MRIGGRATIENEARAVSSQSDPDSMQSSSQHSRQDISELAMQDDFDKLASNIKKKKALSRPLPESNSRKKRFVIKP